MFLCLIPIVRGTKILWRSLFQFWVSRFGCRDRLNWKNIKIKGVLWLWFLVITAYDISIFFTINLPLFFLKIHEMENLVKQPTSTIIYFSWYTLIDLAYFTYHILYGYSLLKYKIRKSAIRISFINFRYKTCD